MESLGTKSFHLPRPTSGVMIRVLGDVGEQRGPPIRGVGKCAARFDNSHVAFS